MLDDVVSERPGNMREFMIKWMKTKGNGRRPVGTQESKL